MLSFKTMKSNQKEVYMKEGMGNEKMEANDVIWRNDAMIS
jgi:hypothetical protein